VGREPFTLSATDLSGDGPVRPITAGAHKSFRSLAGIYGIRGAKSALDFTAEPSQSFPNLFVEVRGFEPLSFDLGTEASPGASGDLFLETTRAPARSASPSPVGVLLGTRTLPRSEPASDARPGIAGISRLTAT